MDRCCIPYRLAPYTNHFLFLVDPNQQLLIAFHPNNLLRYLKHGLKILCPTSLQIKVARRSNNTASKSQADLTWQLF